MQFINWTRVFGQIQTLCAASTGENIGLASLSARSNAVSLFVQACKLLFFFSVCVSSLVEFFVKMKTGISCNKLAVVANQHAVPYL